jgi:hypothetical protein
MDVHRVDSDGHAERAVCRIARSAHFPRLTKEFRTGTLLGENVGGRAEPVATSRPDKRRTQKCWVGDTATPQAF